MYIYLIFFLFLFFFSPIIDINLICKYNFFNFLIEINKNEILIIEKNDFHGECLPGFIKYFIDLGYNKIDVIINPKLFKLNPLNNIFNNKLNIFVYSSKFIEKFLALGICDYYKICFFNSFKYKKGENLKNFLYKNQKFKKLLVFHNLNDIKKQNEEYFISIVLKKFNKTNNHIYEINPHFFGEYKIHNKSKKTTFITAGNIENNRKNFNILFKGIKYLIKKNIFNFHVTLIGSGIKENFYKKFSIKNKLKNYITFTGRIPYDKMYELILEADFFLPLLDPKIHSKYLKEKTSGSFQLSYGFNIPMLIEKKFSEKYGFNNKNSIIYNSEKDFFNKLKYSIEMQNETYYNLKYNLNIKAKKIEKKSIENLKLILNK